MSKAWPYKLETLSWTGVAGQDTTQTAGRRRRSMAKLAERYIRHNGENLWDFEIVSQRIYENVNRIHPLKQRDVGRLSFWRRNT